MVQNGKVKIYLADIRPLFDETMQKKALAQLDEVRRQKALSCRQTKQRAASLTAVDSDIVSGNSHVSEAADDQRHHWRKMSEIDVHNYRDMVGKCDGQ